MDNVRTLQVALAKKSFEPNDKLIKFLQGILDQAKEGKLRAVAVATVYHDDLDPGGEASEGWNYSSGTKFSLSHALLRLNAQWGRHLIEDEPSRGP